MSQGAHDALFDGINNGTITDAEASAMFVSLAAPYDRPDGSVDTSNIIQQISTDKQMRAILANFTGNGDFMRRDQLQPGDMDEFVSKFPDPLYFESQAQEFIRGLGSSTGRDTEKQQQYEQSLNNFMRIVYGKRYEYYQQYRLLKAEAAEEFNRTTPHISQEYQQSKERLTTYASSAQMSKYEIAEQKVATGERNPSILQQLEYLRGHNDDSVVCDTERGVFGVFDGVGGTDNGERASNIAKWQTEHFAFSDNEDRVQEEIKQCLMEASALIDQDTARSGQTTATLARLVQRSDGSKRLHYGQVGDSRLYVLHEGRDAVQVTRDEGEGKYIDNALGVNGTSHVTQLGHVDLVSGDLVVLCTDGVTGDKGADLVSEQELTRWLRSSQPGKEADALISNGRKLDDRSAVVFKV